MNTDIAKSGESTQFKPGQSGNPSGRPKGPITQFLREFGEAVEIRFTIDKTDATGKQTKATSRLSTGDQTINQAIAARLLQMALAGDMKAITAVLNRTEGRVPQPIIVAPGASAGGELKAWSGEEVDRYEQFLALTAAGAVTVSYEEVGNENDEQTGDED